MKLLGKRAPVAPLEYTRRWSMRIWVGLVLLFLYTPLITLVAFSFNDSRRNIVWRGFTTKYYEKALHNSSLMEALTNSITIAALTRVDARGDPVMLRQLSDPRYLPGGSGYYWQIERDGHQTLRSPSLAGRPLSGALARNSRVAWARTQGPTGETLEALLQKS